MNKAHILLITLLLSNAALAEPCTILNYTSADNVNSLTGEISVTAVQTGNILKNQNIYREVIQENRWGQLRLILKLSGTVYLLGQ